MELPEAGKKGAGPQEENKALKEEVKTLKEELDTTKKGVVQKNAFLCRLGTWLVCFGTSCLLILDRLLDSESD